MTTMLLEAKMDELGMGVQNTNSTLTYVNMVQYTRWFCIGIERMVTFVVGTNTSVKLFPFPRMLHRIKLQVKFFRSAKV